MTPILGFLPDVDVATPGALTSVSNVVPTQNGMKGAPTAIAISGVPVLTNDCRNAAIAGLLNGTRRVLAGTAADLFELSGGNWVSRGTGYTLGADDRWDFAQFGDSTLATNLATAIQRSTGVGFTGISGAPAALAIEVAAGFALAFNTIDGVYGTSPHRWRCSALLNETDWTPALSTQSATGLLVSTTGAITAAKAFGDQVVVYKDRSMYFGTYVGTPEVWRFELIPVDVGCVGVDAVTDVAGRGHVIVGRSDIMLFDGTRPVSIADGKVRQWFYNNVSQQYLYRTTVVHDKQNDSVWIHYPSVESTGLCDSAIVYHMGRQQWGRVTQTIQAALNYVAAGTTIDTMGATIDTQPAVSIDSQFWLSGGRMFAVVTSARQISSLTGTTGDSSMSVFEVGDDQVVSKLSRVRVAYQQDPTSATVAGQTRMARGAAAVTGGSGTYSAGKFDIRQSGRFHKILISNVGDWAAAGVDFDFKPAGQR